MKLIEKADDNRMDEKDKRIKLMNEILSGIKVSPVKLKAWISVACKRDWS